MGMGLYGNPKEEKDENCSRRSCAADDRNGTGGSRD